MECFSSSSSTGSSQNQPSVSSQAQEAGSFQNQHHRRSRKRGIAALLADVTNQISETRPVRVCREETISKVSTAMAPEFGPRGDPLKGAKNKAKALKTIQASQSDDACTLYNIYTKDRELFDKGQEYICNFVSKNVSWDVQKAVAIQIMTSAMTELGKGIVDAAKFAAATTGFSQEVVRRWAFSYFTALNQYPGSIDDLDLDFIETQLSSERGKGCGNADSILHDEEFQLSARKYIRSNAYRKGAPNLTTEMFCKWIKDEFGVEVCCETARVWLHFLGFNMSDHQKGVFFDGHDREDVVEYRKDLLARLEKLDETTITPSTPCPSVVDGENKYIRVYHDESTFYANADQTRFWNDGQSQVLRQKALGSSIMVSDFIVEGYGYLCHEEKAARLLLETQKDGYFNSEMFLEQVDGAIDVFERRFPGVTGIFLFDNAPSHRKYPPDGLNPANMNVYPGGKQAVMRDTVWDGSTQKMVLQDGTPKGMKLVLQERGVDVKGLNADKMRAKLSEFEDFSNQKTLLEELVHTKGHNCLYLPKYHCEMNPIERNWCHAKKVARQYVNGSIVRLREVVPTSLNAVSIEMMNKFCRTCRDYEMAYRSGCNGKDVEIRVKQYKSHRRVFSTNS